MPLVPHHVARWALKVAVFAPVVAALVPLGALAQCNADAWLPTQGAPGTNLLVAASTMWDPDGAGPLTPKIVIGGRFDVAGDAVAANIACFDPVSGEWSSLGSGMAGLATVYALAALPDGSLVAAGQFDQAGGVPVNNIARWNGNAWSALGDGLQAGEVGDAVVRALAVFPNGDLAAGGDFLIAGSVVAHSVARWNGSEWSSFGTGVGGSSGNTPVYALAVLRNGNLVAGGDFTTAGGANRSHIARWNGSSWQAMGAGVNLNVYGLSVAPNGNLFATGAFTIAGSGPAARIARWNSTASSAGTAWSTLGTGLGYVGFCVRALANGDILAGGDFIEAGGSPARRLARWNGTTWSALGTGLDYVFGDACYAFAITEDASGDIFVGGQFTSAGSAAATNIARWNGADWASLGSGFNDFLLGLEALPNGDVIAGGAFSTAGSSNINVAARWNGSTWSAIGSPGLSPTGFVSDIAVRSNGDIVIGGAFWLPGADWRVDPPTYIASWDGTAWSDMGAAMDGYVYALALLPGGDLVAGGTFSTVAGTSVNNIARWNGVAWSAMSDGLGTTGTGDLVSALTVLSTGELIAGGSFPSAGEEPAVNLARWDGTTWLPIASEIDGTITGLASAPAGTLVATGYFTSIDNTPSSGVAVWNGTSWSALGSGITDGTPFAAAAAPNGDIYVTGQFSTAGGQPASNFARWNGSAWSAIGLGLDSGTEPGQYSIGYSIARRANGEILVGGQFLRADGQTSVNFARLCTATDCPADFNQSGVVTVQDIFDFLNAYFAGLPSADFNHIGGLTVQDIFDFLGAYFVGCA